ncbi:MAG: sigma 54-interacting transcriptional regulator, partial [Planctomycetota bacterium]|nr:sigma 54-interacting transcriptional regulator [Planctomycetota bacterium]
AGDEWVVRDLNSRNGTLLGRKQVLGDEPLFESARIRIGLWEAAFTHDPAQLPDLSEEPLDRETNASAAGTRSARTEAEVESTAPEPEILHRRRETRFGELARRDSHLRDRVSRELAALYRLALDMGRFDQTGPLSGAVLDALLESTPANIGAVLLLPDGSSQAQDLAVAAFRAPDDAAYDRVSDYLSQAVLTSGEAVLGNDVAEDSRLASRDSLGRMRARSVICAPTRHELRINGLVHLYATDPDNPLDVDDLEFTLAVADQLGGAIEAINRRQALADDLGRVEVENQSLRQQLQIESELIGRSAAVEALRIDIGHVAPTDATVLIRGESGVGKELVARALHLNSRRRTGPFVCLNCAALTESILESELFGHEKGSFTGATGRKIGKFEAANGGTLFLDEVGEMSLAIQSKFLRVLEGHPFERVGGNQSIRADVRVVAATNRDLEEAVEEGSFRRDLYFRLHVVVLNVEPLRNRPGDVELLAEHFRRKFVAKAGRTHEGFAREALEVLRNYDWPGNVRELQNAIERAVILCRSERIEPSDIRLTRLGSDLSEVDAEVSPSIEGGFHELSLEALERKHILETLDFTDWNKSRAAQILGIERSTLDRKLKRYRVRRPSR